MCRGLTGEISFNVAVQLCQILVFYVGIYDHLMTKEYKDMQVYSLGITCSNLAVFIVEQFITAYVILTETILSAQQTHDTCIAD